MDKSESERLAALAEILYQDYEYKHSNSWSILSKSVVATAVLISVPIVFFESELATSYALIFPGLSLFLVVVTSILLNTELSRVRRAERAYRSVLFQLMTPREREIYENIEYPLSVHVPSLGTPRETRNILEISVGKTMVIGWLFGGSAVSIMSFALVLCHS